jgi:hypothetical protein
MCGTTLRIFDPGIGGWRIIWNDPLNQDYSVQIGRAEGKGNLPKSPMTRAVRTFGPPNKSIRPVVSSYRPSRFGILIK